MSETLKVVFQADDAELQSALQRSSRRLDDFDKRFAKRRDALPVPTSSFNGWEQSATKAAKATRELEHAGYRAGKGGMAGSFGFLAFSQAVEDAQYGMRGVLNNIPQMVIGFGGSMGLAGAVSLAAVAFATLLPKIKELYGIADGEALRGGDEEWKKIFDAGMQTVKALEDAASAEQRLANYSAIYNQYLADRLMVLSNMTGVYDAQLEAARKQRDAEAEIAAARESQVRAMGGDTKPLVVSRQRTEITGIDSDLANRTEELTRLQDELLQANQRRDNFIAESQIAEEQRTARLIELNRQLTLLQADAGRNDKINEILPGTDRFSGLANAAIYKEQIEDLQNQIAELEAETKAADEATKQFRQQIDNQIDSFDSSVNSTSKQIQELKALREQRLALQKIERENIAIEEAKSKIAALQNESTKLTRQSETADKQIEASSALAEELSILQQKLGLTKEARDVLDEEVKLRREAAGIAKEAGIDEDVVLQALKQRAAAQQQLAKQTPKGTLREQGDARRAERAERRAEERNQRQAEARARQKERNERNNERKLDQDKQKTELEKAREALEKEREKQRKDKENIDQKNQKTLEESKAIQERIQEAISKISAA